MNKAMKCGPGDVLPGPFLYVKISIKFTRLALSASYLAIIALAGFFWLRTKHDFQKDNSVV